MIGLPALCGLAISANAQLGSFASDLGGQSSPLPYNLDIAIGQRAPGAAKAALLRASVIRSFARSPMCFKADMTPAQWQEAMDRFQLLPPTLTPPDPNDPFGDRFNTDLYMWDANGNAGVDAGTASRANLTFSFPADGTTWGIAQSGFAPGPNVLGASLAAANQFGNTEKGREYLRQCLATWKRYGGITYTEVADDNSPQDNATTHVSTRGDIRIGAVALGTATPVLAYNCFPAPGGLVGFSLVGGDMCINASYFGNTDAFASTSNNYRFLRNTCTHEHGHGLGFIHQVPCSGTKLMEPQIATGFDAVQTDDRRAAGRNYGDRNSGNQSLATAKDFGNLSTPVLRSIGAREQSLNGYWDSGNNPTGADYFKFALGSAQNVKIIATPRGGLYTTGQQAGGCNGTTTSHNSTALGNLAYELMSADGTVSIGVVDATATGAIESSTFNALPAGSYAVRVWDNNPANDPLGDDPNTIVQLYDFEIQVGTNVYEDPYANAGVNKRIAAGTACQFIGDINSAITETRIAVTLSRFEWDLDGDGAFETGVAPAASQPKPTFT